MIQVYDGNYFACDECPLMCQKELARRLELEEEYGEFQYDHLGCDKVQHDFFAGGYCGDAFIESNSREEHSARKTGAAYRRTMTKRKKKRSIRIATTDKANWWSGWVEHDFVDGAWVPVGKYVKRHHSSKRQQFYKRYSNRRVRHGAMTGGGKSGYKRCFDYRWEMD